MEQASSHEIISAVKITTYGRSLAARTARAHGCHDTADKIGRMDSMLEVITSSIREELKQNNANVTQAEILCVIDTITRQLQQNSLEHLESGGLRKKVNRYLA